MKVISCRILASSETLAPVGNEAGPNDLPDDLSLAGSVSSQGHGLSSRRMPNAGLGLGLGPV